MKIGFVFNQKLPSILISAVIGLLLALIIGISTLDLLAYELRNQLLILVLLSFGLGVFCYTLLTRSLAYSKTLLTLNDPEPRTVIRKIFLAVFFLFPIAFILYQQIVELLQIIRSGHSSDFIEWLWMPPTMGGRDLFITVFVLSLLFILALLVAGTRSPVGNVLNNLPDTYFFLFIFLSSLAIRLPIIYLINTQPISDFGIINEDALALAQGENPTHMYVATHVAVTMIYGFLYQVFGSDLNVLKIFHAAAYGLSGIFIYTAGRIAFGSKLWAVTAAFLLVIWPSLAFYSNVLTPEHLFILVECALIFAVAHWFENRENVERKTDNHRPAGYLVWSSIIGFLLGIMGMFRPFSELFLLAFVLTLLVYTRNLKMIVVSLFCLLISFWLLRDVPSAIATHYQNRFGNIRPCNLLVGLNFEAAGQYNAEDHELCSKLRSENLDDTAFTKAILGILRERFLEQQDNLISFANKKFAVLWANSNAIFFWAVQEVTGGDPYAILNIVRKVNLVDFAIMFIITFACLIGTVIAFFKETKPVIFFCLLTLFGFNLMEIPFELQTRYRTVMMPVLIFFACWTFAALSAWMTTRNRVPSMLQRSQESK